METDSQANGAINSGNLLNVPSHSDNNSNECTKFSCDENSSNQSTSATSDSKRRSYDLLGQNGSNGLLGVAAADANFSAVATPSVFGRTADGSSSFYKKDAEIYSSSSIRSSLTMSTVPSSARDVNCTSLSSSSSSAKRPVRVNKARRQDGGSGDLFLSRCWCGSKQAGKIKILYEFSNGKLIVIGPHWQFSVAMLIIMLVLGIGFTSWVCPRLQVWYHYAAGVFCTVTSIGNFLMCVLHDPGILRKPNQCVSSKHLYVSQNQHEELEEEEDGADDSNDKISIYSEEEEGEEKMEEKEEILDLCDDDDVCDDGVFNPSDSYVSNGIVPVAEEIQLSEKTRTSHTGDRGEAKKIKNKNNFLRVHRKINKSCDEEESETRNEILAELYDDDHFVTDEDIMLEEDGESMKNTNARKSHMNRLSTDVAEHQTAYPDEYESYKWKRKKKKKKWTGNRGSKGRAEYRKLNEGREYRNKDISISIEDDDMDDSENRDDILVEKKKKKAYVCEICGLVPPSGAWHCEDCEVCIEGYDHHCPWTSKCIGKKNLKYFYLWIVMGMMSVVYMAIVAGLSAPSSEFHARKFSGPS